MLCIICDRCWHVMRWFALATGRHAIIANCLIYSQALLEYVILFCCWSFGCVLLAKWHCYLPSNLRKIRCSFSLFFVKNAKIVRLLSLTLILTLISRADWSDKSEWYFYCCQISGVTRVGVTQGGNWWCHPYFFLTIFFSFLVTTVCQLYSVNPIFLKKLMTFSPHHCDFVWFHSGVTPLEGVTPDLFFICPTLFVHCSL